MRADEMDPQAAAAVERQSRIPIPHNRYALKLFRGLMQGVSRLRNRNLPDVGATADATIPGPDGDLDARLSLPEGDGPFPTVVFFHGGGFVFGTVETHEWLCRHLANDSGCGVLSVEYRLAPEHPFPAAVEDAYAAVEWASEHTDALSGTGRVAVAGDSAGGNLAAVVSLMTAKQDGPDIAYQTLLYPGVGVDPDQRSVAENEGIVLSRADIEWFGDCYYGNDIHRRNPYADPTNAADVSGVPPATVVTAGFDPLRDGGKRCADQLAADGVDTRHVNYDDMVHGFLTMREVDTARDGIRDVAGDLGNALYDG
ncbi:alpha/beta hydrolase [Halosegnis rubeus]|jgi:acetyl esterase|uniref:Alpha/beta hydrolase fold domain-containing protein n=1 Tax=Halosegnis rubeus TaxID=2212850 RepID=A0A5N5U4H1_9EURY|nr:alpha/beta hydrolase [Halosegnis rubeus]KAB7513496.1 alpha/beta hydrolase fold domain-containing protein [Halosegnis rubeus]